MFALFPRLAERAQQLAGTMSGGEQQMLAIGRALMARPRLLLMDEPSMGLSPAFVDQVFDIIQTINRQGVTILVVEQNAVVALGIANRGYVLQNGRMVAADTAARCSPPTTSGALIWARSEPMDMLSILPQQLVFGLALGTVYGLIAIGYTMVYGVLFMINFAHGEVFMIGAYIGWGVLSGLLASQDRRPAPGLGAADHAAAGDARAAALLGTALERFAYRPLYARGATRLGPLISAVGASIFLQNAVMLSQGARMKVYMTNFLFPRGWRFEVFGVSVSVLLLVVAAVALVMMWGLHAPGPAHHARARDPRRRRGPRDGGDHGRRRQPGGRDHVLSRLRARRRGRRADRPVLHPDRLLHGLLGGAQGVHRGRARRHRQHQGRDARRPAAGRDRKPGGDLHRPGLQGRDRLPRADPGPHLPARGPARRIAGRLAEGLSMDPARRQRIAFAALGAVALLAPLLAPNDYVMGVIARICLYALLALGLNIVVGFAGLLDIGYVAFFGIGSYVYAFLASPHFGIHLPFLVALPIVVVATARLGRDHRRADAARPRRLSGDRHAGLRRDRLSAAGQPRPADQHHRRTERDHRRRSARRSPVSCPTTTSNTISCSWRSSRSPC